MSARTDSGWLWFRWLAIAVGAAFAMKLVFAIGARDLNSAGIAFVGGLGSLIVFGPVAFFVGWLTGPKSSEPVANPSSIPLVSPTFSNAKSTRPPIALAEPDDSIYGEIAEELESGKTDKALWTKAFAEADGDEARTRAAYIKLRARQMTSAKQ